MEKTKALVVQPSELDKIYRGGKVSPDVRNSFSTSLEKGLSREGVTIDHYMETNTRLKMEMKEYLDRYQLQRSTMEAVIYYLKNPSQASVRFADKVTGFFGKKGNLEAKRIAKDPQAIRKLFEEMALSIEQSRGKTQELEQQAISLYNASLSQRENVDRDITELLKKISINKDDVLKLEDEVNKVNGSMDKLLIYMEKIGMVVKGGRPMLEDSEKNVGEKTDTIAQDVSSGSSYEDRLNKLIKQNGIENANKAEKSPADNVTNADSSTGQDSNKENIEHAKPEDTRTIERRKIEAIKVYHSINNEILKIENSLRDARNQKLVLHQNYERAKENLVLYEKVLITQVDEARNYFAMLFAIYDAEVKYTLPSARLIASLASLQEVASQLTQQIYDARNIFNNLIENVTSGALEIQEGIQLLAISQSWDPERIERSENRTIELARRTKEFSLEMDRRLLEIESVYRDPSLQERIKDKAKLESGIEDGFLRKLLVEDRTGGGSDKSGL
jgi:ribosomal protein S16